MFVNRKLRNIDMNMLKDDILNSFLSTCTLTAKGPSEAVEQYNTTLKQLLDKHAPEQSTLVSLRPRTPWYTESVREAKRLRRRAERRLIKSDIEINRQLNGEQCKAYHQVLNQARSDYMTTEITECDSKQLFKLVKNGSLFLRLLQRFPIIAQTRKWRMTLAYSSLKVHRNQKQLKFAFILVLDNFPHSFRFLHYFLFILTK